MRVWRAWPVLGAWVWMSCEGGPGEPVEGLEGAGAGAWPALEVEQGAGVSLRAALGLSLAPGLVPGEVATYTVTGANPGETVIVGGSLQGQGAGPCPGVLGGLCVDLVPPLRLVGTAVADASGVAVVQGPVPALPIGVPVSVQAVVRRGAGGSTSVKSDPRTDRVHAAWVSGLASRPVNSTCLAPPDGPVHDRSLAVQRAFPLLTFDKPVEMVQPPDDPDQWWIVEKTGHVWRFADSDATATKDLVIDLSGVVYSASQEMGLLGMAFHPDFAVNGQVFLDYTIQVGAQYYDEIHRYTSLDGGLTLDPSTDELLLSIPDPFTNHNGGKLAFGWDGYLYYGVGDGGSAGDPGNRAQNTNVELGKLLRFDVDNGTPYAIPPDNPFADGIGGLPEIYAWGLRNPWRWSFDRATGDLWLGDVGQNVWEEVDRIELGGNYGWDWREGFACYTANCSTVPGLTDPLVAYDPGGAAAVIGGFVYRGTALPDLVGTYVFADYYTNKIDGIVYDSQGVPSISHLATVAGFSPSSFAEDADGELYVLEYTNEVWRIIPAGAPPVDDFPTLLSQTGCVDAQDPTIPAASLVPFEPNSKLWSDGAAKQRWMAIPDGQTVTIGADGDWDFPIGSVLMKEFQVGGHRVETRLLVRHDDGTWAGYAYAWDANETDATLVEGGATVATVDGDWRIPSSTECLQCHTQAAGRVLGPRTEQLNRDLDYGGTVANQVHTLASIGWFTDAPAEHPDLLPALPDPNLLALPVEDRARSYLDGNCSHCHRPGGPGQGDLDFRYTTVDTGGCGTAPIAGNLGVPTALVIDPGDHANSVVSLRMHALDANRMPPLGTVEVDPLGTSVVDGWIDGLTACP